MYGKEVAKYVSTDTALLLETGKRPISKYQRRGRELTLNDSFHDIVVTWLKITLQRSLLFRAHLYISSRDYLFDWRVRSMLWMCYHGDLPHQVRRFPFEPLKSRIFRLPIPCKPNYHPSFFGNESQWRIVQCWWKSGYRTGSFPEKIHKIQIRNIFTYLAKQMFELQVDKVGKHSHSRPLLAPRPLRGVPPLRRAISFSPPFSLFSFPSSPVSAWLVSFWPDTLFFFPTISQESLENHTEKVSDAPLNDQKWKKFQCQPD